MALHCQTACTFTLQQILTGVILLGFILSVDTYTEELLVAHELELKNVKQYYNTHRDLLEKIARRQEYFKNMIVFEVRHVGSHFDFRPLYS